MHIQGQDPKHVPGITRHRTPITQHLKPHLNLQQNCLNPHKRLHDRITPITYIIIVYKIESRANADTTNDVAI